MLGMQGWQPALAADGSLALQAGWRVAQVGEAAESVERADPRLQHFDPAQLKSFPAGAWVLLWPADGRWPAPPWILDVDSPGLQTLTLHRPGLAAPQVAQLLTVDAGAWPAHGRLAFPIDVAPAAGEPLRLFVDTRGVMPAAMTFAVRPVPDFLRADALWLAFASTCLAIMAAMAMMALFFAIRLRDATFLYYVIFVLAYALILGLQTGYIVQPLGWHALARTVTTWGPIATVASVVFAVLFLNRFADLTRYVPVGRRWLLGYAVAIAAIALAGLLPLPGSDWFGKILINPLLILGGPLLLGVAGLAAWRGSRYAVFFLAGWTPLLVVTVLGSAQLYGALAAWTWLDDAALATGAFESVVLSLGLADRSVSLRRDRDHARQLADIDPLTGLFNRRAWSERVLVLEETMRRRNLPLSMLFLDLDRFKALNDRFGHEAGDAALRVLSEVMRTQLRQQDLIGRYGGEEFVVALPGADSGHARQVAERIRDLFPTRAAAFCGDVAPTVSIGVATLRPGEDTVQLLRRADEALYAAKDGGRNRVVWAEESDSGVAKKSAPRTMVAP